MRLVLDTNVLIAAFIAHGTCHELLEHCYRQHEIFTTDKLLGEFRRTMAEKFGFSRTDVTEAVQTVRGMVRVVEPGPLEAPVCRDPDDDHVLAAAAGADAACIVTGDEDLLILRMYAGIQILSPRQFWRFEQDE